MNRKRASRLSLAAFTAAWVVACCSGQGWEARSPNPSLANSPWPIIHHSSAQEASSPLPGPDGTAAAGLQADFLSSITGPGPVLFDSRGNLLVESVDILRRKHIFRKLDPESLTEISSYEIGIEDPLNGLYCFVDREDCWWNAYSRTFSRLCFEGDKVRQDMTIDLQSLYPDRITPNDSIIGMNPLYGSRGWMDIAFVTQGLKSIHKDGSYFKTTIGAKIGVLRVMADRTTRLFVQAYPEENITNNFAVDPEDGIYLLTNKHASKLRLEGDGDRERLVTVWSMAYDSGPPIEAFPCEDSVPDYVCGLLANLKNVRFADGSGTTPTLLGPDLGIVGFADGARPLSVVVLRASDGSSVEVDGAVPFSDPRAQTENTITAFGGRFVLENNAGPGVAAYELVDGPAGWAVRPLWVNAEVFAPNAVPMISGPSRAVYVYERQGGGTGGDPARWFVTALDLESGSLLWRHFVGEGMDFNSLYAPLSLDARKRVYIGLLGSLLRLREAGAAAPFAARSAPD